MNEEIEAAGGLAYPLTVPTAFDALTGVVTKQDVHLGMTLRDYFAGQILMANADSNSERDKIAMECYRLADAMLVAREKSHD